MSQTYMPVGTNHCFSPNTNRIILDRDTFRVQSVFSSKNPGSPVVNYSGRMSICGESVLWHFFLVTSDFLLLIKSTDNQYMWLFADLMENKADESSDGKVTKMSYKNTPEKY